MYTSRYSRTLGLHRIFAESLVSSSTSRIFSAIRLLNAIENGEMCLILPLWGSISWSMPVSSWSWAFAEYKSSDTDGDGEHRSIAAKKSSFSLTTAMVSVVASRQTARALESESSLVSSTQLRSAPIPCNTNSLTCLAIFLKCNREITFKHALLEVQI